MTSTRPPSAGESIRGALGGLAAAALVMLTVGGGFLLSLTESGAGPAGARIALGASPTPTALASPTAIPTIAPPSPTPEPTATPEPSVVASPTPLPTLPPPTVPPTVAPTHCGPPSGWRPVTVQRGDTLFGLALRYGVSVDEIANANCLSGAGLVAGARLYLPPVAATVVVECGPPSDWVLYTIQQGENLFRLSLRYGVTLAQMQKANCINNPADIRAGQQIYVPPVEAMTVTPSPSPAETATPAETPLEAPTDTPAPTDTAEAAPTDTPVPTDTVEDPPTDTPIPTDTPPPPTDAPTP